MNTIILVDVSNLAKDSDAEDRRDPAKSRQHTKRRPSLFGGEQFRRENVERVPATNRDPIENTREDLTLAKCDGKPTEICASSKQ